MRKIVIAILLAMAMISVGISAVSGIPDEKPTEEEVEEIVMKLMETQKESKGFTGSWIWCSIPNRHKNGNGAIDDDIAPELMYRAQYGLSRWFKVDYSIQSTNSGTIERCWDDEFWTDADSGQKWNKHTLEYQDEELTEGNNHFECDPFEPPFKATLDMNIDVDVENHIEWYEGDYNLYNNIDEEYMYFWWLG